jgi:hypothetical protein
VSSGNSGTPVGRRLFVLLGHESSTSAATAPWGVLGIEGPDGEGRWATWLSRLPLTEDSGQWQERLNGLAGIGRLITPEVLDYWAETANGVVWEIEELEAEDVPELEDLRHAVEAFVDHLLAYPLDDITPGSAGPSESV